MTEIKKRYYKLSLQLHPVRRSAQETSTLAASCRTSLTSAIATLQARAKIRRCRRRAYTSPSQGLIQSICGMLVLTRGCSSGAGQEPFAGGEAAVPARCAGV